MTPEDEEQEQQSGWMKRIRWSRSGQPLLDERINALASLWAEGFLPFAEFSPEIREALRQSTARPQLPAGSGQLDDYVNNIRTAAQWIALLEVIHFSTEHQLTSPEERVDALRFFERELRETSRALGAPDRSWIADVCEFRSQTEEADDLMHQLVSRWVAGEGIESNEDLIEQSIAVRRPIRDCRLPDLDEPEQALHLWIDVLRASVQGLVLRETDAYCRAAGLESPPERARAWREMLAALGRPPREHAI